MVCLDNLVPHRVLWPGDEVSLVQMHPVECLEVHIGLVHRVDGPFVRLVHIQEVAVVSPAVGDIDGVRYTSPKVQDSVRLDTSFRVFAQGPFGQPDAARDCRRVNREDLPSWKVNIRDALLRIHRTDFLYEPQAERLEDPVVPDLVCFGQG